MKIVVNCFSISDERTGVGHYTYHLLRAMARLGGAEFILIFARDAGARLDFIGPPFTVIEAPLLGHQSAKRIAWENIFLPGILGEKQADLYFSPDYFLPMRRVPCQTVVKVHDLAFISYPRTKNRRYGTYIRLVAPLSARRAGAVIAVSDYTKGEIVRLLGIPGARIRRIYDGREEDFGKGGRDDLMATDLEPYIFYAGALEERKNLVRLVEAFSLLKGGGNLPHRLVLTGPRKFAHGRIWAAVEKLGLARDVIETGYVDAKKLIGLYRGASLFVLPSIYEGFGLPLLEAMSCGIPVAASNVTAMPEVAGDAALYFNPFEVGEIAMAMRKLIEDDGLRADLVRRGFERSKYFSWDKCARETLELFRSVTEGR